MPMPPYPIYCSTKGCKNLATYKIAGKWSDGMQSELKTYGLCCADCLKNWYRKAQEKQSACHPPPGEILEAPGVYHMERGHRDQQLQRLVQLEQELAS